MKTIFAAVTLAIMAMSAPAFAQMNADQGPASGHQAPGTAGPTSGHFGGMMHHHHHHYRHHHHRHYHM